MGVERPGEPSRSQVSVKTVATIAGTLLAIAGTVLVVVQARLALTVVVVAGILSVAINHAVELLGRLHLRRTPAVVLVLVGLLSALVGVGFVLVPPAVEQVRAFAGNAPELFRRLREGNLYRLLDRRFGLDARLQELLAEAPDLAQQAAGKALRALSTLVTTAGAAVTVLVLVVFMLAFARPLIAAMLAETLPAHRERYSRVLGNIYRSIGGFVGGLAIVVTVNAAVTTAFLAVIRVPYFLPLGILSGMSSLLPLVGNTFAGLLITVVALVTGGLWRAVATAGYFVLYQQFENQLLGPLVYKQTVHLNPLVGLLALLVLTELAGIPGALASVPAAAVGQVILRELLAFRRERLDLPAPPAPPAPATRRRARKRRG